MARGRNYEEHSFFCLKCGNKGIPVQRQKGFQHADNHRKKLYCIHCKTFEDVINFKEDFQNGVYFNEAEESVSFVRGARIG